jgi:hypothetical protein
VPRPIRLGCHRGRHQHHPEEELLRRHGRCHLWRLLRRRRLDDQGRRQRGFRAGREFLFNLTAQVSNHGHTDRGNLDPRTEESLLVGQLPNSNIPLAPGYPYVNHIQGDAETHFKTRGLQCRIQTARRRRALQQRHLRHQGRAVLRELPRSVQDLLQSNHGRGIGGPDGLTPPAAGTTIVTYPSPWASTRWRRARRTTSNWSRG